MSSSKHTEPPPGGPASAVVMSLHGTRATAASQARLSGFGQLAGPSLKSAVRNDLYSRSVYAA